MTELVEAEPAFARSLLEALSRVQAPHIIFDLLRFEANLVLDKTSKLLHGIWPANNIQITIRFKTDEEHTDPA